MKMKLKILLTVMAMGLSTWAQDILDDVHPNYDLVTIRPAQANQDQNGSPLAVYPESGDGFDAPVVGMTWMEEGALMLVLTWRGDTGPRGEQVGDHPRDGRLWLISGVENDNRSDISGQLLADDFKDAHGVEYLDGEIYVCDIDRLVKLVDSDNDGFYETHQEVVDFPQYNGWFEYTFGLRYYDGLF